MQIAEFQTGEMKKKLGDVWASIFVISRHAAFHLFSERSGKTQMAVTLEAVFQWVCDMWFSLAEISFLSHHQRFAWGPPALPTWGEPSFPACLQCRGNPACCRKKANLIPTVPDPGISLSEGGLRTGSLRMGHSESHSTQNRFWSIWKTRPLPHGCLAEYLHPSDTMGLLSFPGSFQDIWYDLNED